LNEKPEKALKPAGLANFIALRSTDTDRIPLNRAIPAGRVISRRLKIFSWGVRFQVIEVILSRFSIAMKLHNHAGDSLRQPPFMQPLQKVDIDVDKALPPINLQSPRLSLHSEGNSSRDLLQLRLILAHYQVQIALADDFLPEQPFVRRNP